MQNHYTLNIKMKNDEGAIVRLLGLIQRRGYAIDGISMPSDEGREKALTLTVRPDRDERRIDVLERQIMRLYEVTDVKATPQPKQKRFFSFFTPAPSMQGVQAPA